MNLFIKAKRYKLHKRNYDENAIESFKLGLREIDWAEI